VRDTIEQRRRGNSFGRPMIAVLSRSSRLVLIAVFALLAPAVAAVDPVATPTHVGRGAAELYQWQRVDLHASGFPLRNRPQIKVGIRTKGPCMQGLLRIPGAPASNFNTGKGLTIVDLINVGNDSSGYADIVALELVFTQTILGQSYEVFIIGYGDQPE